MVMYSPSVKVDGPFLFISGQIPEQNNVIPDNIASQIDNILDKISDILSHNHTSITNIVKMNIFITNTSYLPAVREKVSSFLGSTKPAMTLVVVAGLINESYMLEIDATAQL